MYSLVALLTVCGFLALDRALRVAPRRQSDRRRRRVGTASLHPLLVGVPVGHDGAVAGLPGLARSTRVAAERPAALVAVVIGCLTFLPWLPTFLYQSKHTGTPWATPASFAAMVSAIASFAGGNSSQGRGLALLFFALVGLGPVRPRHRPPARRSRHPHPADRAPAGRRRRRHPGRGHHRRSGHQQRLRCPLCLGGVHPAHPARGPRADRVPRPPRPGRRPGTGRRAGPRRIDPQRDDQPDPGRRGGGGHRQVGSAGRCRGVLPGPARPAVNRLLPSGRYQQIPSPEARVPPSSTGSTTPPP